MAVLIIGPTPFIGQMWLPMFHVLAGSAFLILRVRWAVSAYLGLTVAALTWAAALGSDAAEAAWLGFSVTRYGLAPVVLVWLVVALRRLEAARHPAADRAVELGGEHSSAVTMPPGSCHRPLGTRCGRR
jgi:hypothetical protein